MKVNIKSKDIDMYYGSMSFDKIMKWCTKNNLKVDVYKYRTYIDAEERIMKYIFKGVYGYCSLPSYDAKKINIVKDWVLEFSFDGKNHPTLEDFKKLNKDKGFINNGSNSDSLPQKEITNLYESCTSKIYDTHNTFKYGTFDEGEAKLELQKAMDKGVMTEDKIQLNEYKKPETVLQGKLVVYDTDNNKFEYVLNDVYKSIESMKHKDHFPTHIKYIGDIFDRVTELGLTDYYKVQIKSNDDQFNMEWVKNA